MAPKRPAAEPNVQSFRYDETRKHIPPAGLASQGRIAEATRARYSYEPDFLVRLADDSTLVLDVNGQDDEQDRAKHEAARRWIDAVNTWGALGVWCFHVCKNPQVWLHELTLPRSGAH